MGITNLNVSGPGSTTGTRSHRTADRCGPQQYCRCEVSGMFQNHLDRAACCGRRPPALQWKCQDAPPFRKLQLWTL